MKRWFSVEAVLFFLKYQIMVIPKKQDLLEVLEDPEGFISSYQLKSQAFKLNRVIKL